MKPAEPVVREAIDCGADLAGIAAMADVRQSSSHRLYPRMGAYRGNCTPAGDGGSEVLFSWPEWARSVLVIGIAHPQNRPELDWMDGKDTPGNRILIDITTKIRNRLEERHGIVTGKLHYFVERGGIFLKDAAVLAGLGCIGRNNLLITPEFGPRLRLRALLLDTEIAPTGPVRFTPCLDCSTDCRTVCPEQSMEECRLPVAITGDVSLLPSGDGCYDRDRCDRRMQKDIEASRDKGGISSRSPVHYCRLCEFICPVGRNT